jgi:hypothetical protein
VTQPDYVPISPTDRVRPSDRLPAPRPWAPDRPADLLRQEPPEGRSFGSTGPDLGYGLKLAHRVAERIEVPAGESADDAVAGCFLCGTKRSASFGRAPGIYDMEWAFTLWGFLGGAPAELVAYRAPLFRGAAHHYADQRAIVDRVREDTFRLSPADVRGRLASWREMLTES